MRRLTVWSLCVGAGVESVLFVCAKVGGAIGSCGPSTGTAFVGLIGHVPVAIVQALAGYEFVDASIFAVNAALFALFFFLAGAFFLIVSEPPAAGAQIPQAAPSSASTILERDDRSDL